MIYVYSAMFGDYDEVLPPPKDPKVEYLMFSDKKHDGWKTIVVPAPKDPRRYSRFFKINSHLLPRHDVSIWVDSCLHLSKSLLPLVDSLKGDLGLIKHPRDKCVYEHAQRCRTLVLDSTTLIDYQMGRYLTDGMPKNFGLTENCVIIRKNTEQIKLLNEMWYKLYMEYSQRDQLSLPYVLWRTGIKYDLLPIDSRENEYYSNWGNHLKSNKYINE